MSDDIDLFIEEDGGIQFVHSDDVAGMFEGEPVATRRASHV